MSKKHKIKALKIELAELTERLAKAESTIQGIIYRMNNPNGGDTSIYRYIPNVGVIYGTNPTKQ